MAYATTFSIFQFKNCASHLHIHIRFQKLNNQSLPWYFTLFGKNFEMRKKTIPRSDIANLSKPISNFLWKSKISPEFSPATQSFSNIYISNLSWYLSIIPETCLTRKVCYQHPYFMFESEFGLFFYFNFHSFSFSTMERRVTKKQPATRISTGTKFWWCSKFHSGLRGRKPEVPTSDPTSD